MVFKRIFLYNLQLTEKFQVKYKKLVLSSKVQKIGNFFFLSKVQKSVRTKPGWKSVCLRLRGGSSDGDCFQGGWTKCVTILGIAGAKFLPVGEGSCTYGEEKTA